MDFFDLTFWQGFLGNLLATIIGVAIGIPVAFWINRRVEATTEHEKKKNFWNNCYLKSNLTEPELAHGKTKEKWAGLY